MAQRIVSQTSSTMAFKNKLILQTGANIPFIEGACTIHQPTLFEISLIGEDAFFTGCELLNFSKSILTSEDSDRLKNMTDFDILLSVLKDKNKEMRNTINNAQQVLTLMFPMYEVIFGFDAIELRASDPMMPDGRIDATNFLIFQEILAEMFCLKEVATKQEYQTQGELAKKIADKFKKRQQQLAKLSSKTNEVAIFSRYISILTVGEHKDMTGFMKYTVYQLLDEFRRFELKQSHDATFKARLAGAKDLKDPEDWMKNLHEKD